MNTFNLDGHTFEAEQCIDGVLINPKLPKGFDDTPNEERPLSQIIWWDRPYIVTYTDTGDKWLDAWPSGTRYDVRCLDGGAWDRSTNWGCFSSLEEALKRVTAPPDWHSQLDGKWPGRTC